ncbi:hypothetical protein [Paraburkholderia sp. GAS348]|uniref:hypothetical protein n=1 Tax=Paraburkholderia sp. GAS348 TaxID=3035132 RepID=UPI003D2352FA
MASKRKKKGKDSVGSQDSVGPEALPLFPTLGESAPMPKNEHITNGPAASKASPDVERTASDDPPWANANPKIKAPFSTGIPEELDLKMEWLCDNRPKTSKQRLVQEAIRIYINALIAKYYPSNDE